MFDKAETNLKISQIYQDKNEMRFADTQDEGFMRELQTQKQYAERMKNQRGKIQTLYSKYDSLFKDIKNKEGQIREKDTNVSSINVESRCKGVASISRQPLLLKKQIKPQNITLQRALSELQQSNAFLQGSMRPKETANTQKYQDLEMLNEQLMSKLRSLSRKYQEKEEEYGQKMKNLQCKYDEVMIESKREREQHLEEEEILKTAIMQKDEQINLLQTENSCLRERVSELQSYVNELIYESQQKMEESHKEKKTQVKILKAQIQTLRQNNRTMQKKWQKLKDEITTKQTSLGEMTLVIQQQEKQSNEVLSQIKQQFTQERSQLKEQLIHYENHIVKLERRLTDCLRKEQYLCGKIKKYEGCMNAKRSLRQVEREELDKINMLLNLP